MVTMGGKNNPQNPLSIYIAAPYSHNDKRIMGARAEVCRKVAERSYTDGFYVQCPILTWHDSLLDDVDLNPLHMMRMCLATLRHCDILFIIALDGWRDSAGVNKERICAAENNIKVGIISPDYLLEENVISQSDYNETKLS